MFLRVFSCFGLIYSVQVYHITKYEKQELISGIKLRNGGDLIAAVVDTVRSYPANQVAIGYDKFLGCPGKKATNRNHEPMSSRWTHIKRFEMPEGLRSGLDFHFHLIQTFMSKDVSVISFNLTIVEEQEKFLSNQVKNYLETFSLFFCNFNMYEHILLEIYDRNTMRRNMIYFFYWGTQYPKKFFLRNLHESMKVIVIWNSKNGTYRILSNRATAYKKHHLDMVNWWKDGFGLFHHPTFPLTTGKIYTDFKKKIFKVPVIHKPPWFFVRYTNTTLKVVGGRDDRILSLLASKLNFWYRYIDPPERTQGNAIAKNGSFQGVLGMIWRREADLFIGDVALTEERSNFVEFSFITQADSGAFVTHAPRRLNEAVALLRPFQWEVWPAIIITFIVVGPVLYAIIALPNIWQPRFKVRSQVRLFFDATWFTITILMKQTGKEPSSSQKARFFIIVLSISATYIINDMYSANLTSLLARPGKEKTINDLHQLVDAMENRNYKLYVERSSCGLLENGTGIYGKIWRLMKSRQPKNFLVETVEDGVKLVRDTRNVALIAGRETLIFDIQRFDSSNFHLSEKLNTAYSAIAFQLGCPYIEEINKILMAIFEAGIITKMTQNEYEKLRKQKQLLSSEPEKLTIQRNQKEIKSPLKGNKTNNKLQPVTLKMVQGAFYILAIGYIISGFILLGERIFYNNQHKKLGPSSRHSNKLGSSIKSKLDSIIDCVKKFYRRIMHEAFVATLEYLE